MILRRVRVPGLCALLAVYGSAAAFTFSDGSTMRCFAGGAAVEEVNAPAAHAIVAQGRIAVTEHAGTGYRILWNDARLASLPPAMHDFIFFHECAHASVPTQSELIANCAGLQAMRAAGRAGLSVEAKLAAFYGAGSVYWRDTLACANAAKPAPMPH
jgi:hypothetical protein